MDQNKFDILRYFNLIKISCYCWVAFGCILYVCMGSMNLGNFFLEVLIDLY